MRETFFPTPLIWHTYLLFAILGLLASQWFPAAAIITALLWLADKRLHTRPRSLLGLFCFIAPMCLFLWQEHEIFNRPAIMPEWLKDGKTRICGQIESVRGQADNRARILLSNVTPYLGKPSEPLDGFCLWSLGQPPPDFHPLPGQKVCLTRPARLTHQPVNWQPSLANSMRSSGQANWVIYSKGSQGEPSLSGTPDWFHELREKIFSRFHSILLNNERTLSQAKGILIALLFGDRRYLSNDTVTNFAHATLAHSLALSGQHLSLVGLLALLGVYACAKAAPGIYLLKPRIILIGLLSIPLGIIYLWLGNAPPSLIRAATMMFILLLWVCRGQAFRGIDALFAALLLILVANPLIIFDIGLQLSVLCTGIILLGLPAIWRLMPRFHLHGRYNIIVKDAAQILIISCAVQIFLLPLTLQRFAIAGIWFPLNLLWLPVLSIFVLPLAAAALLFSLPPLELAHNVASFLADMASWPCAWLLKLLNFLNEHGWLSEPAFMTPHWSLFPTFALLFILACWFGAQKASHISATGNRKFIIAAILLLAIAPAVRLYDILDNKLTLETIDVGQGQSILINLAGQNRILVDAGGGISTYSDPGKNVLAPFLSDNMPPFLNAAFNTHPDLDHVGGFFYLLEKFETSTVFHNGHAADRKIQPAWEYVLSRHDSHLLKKGDKIFLGSEKDGLFLEVLHPPASRLKDSNDAEIANAAWFGNHASLVMRLCKDNTGLALFTGDAEKDTLRYLLINGANLSAKILFAPHHGSDRSMLPQFYKAAQPQLVVASCGFHNRWKFPGKKLRAFLEKQHIKLLDTGTHGRISIKFDQNYDWNVQSIMP